MKALRLLLLINGIITLMALPAIFLPLPTMDAIHRWLGLGSLPEGPIVPYLARSTSALYAASGVLTLMLVTDLRRYWPLITWWGVMAIVFGLLLFWIDWTSDMPAYWTWGEAGYLLIVGSAVLVLQSRSRGS